VREQLLRKKEKLLEQLKALAASIPTTLLVATSTKFNELERQLRAKAGSLEDVDAQRRFVAELPNKMAPLVAEVEATKVCARVRACVWRPALCCAVLLQRLT
jgi:hypothetical protein